MEAVVLIVVALGLLLVALVPLLLIGLLLADQGSLRRRSDALERRFKTVDLRLAELLLQLQSVELQLQTLRPPDHGSQPAGTSSGPAFAPEMPLAATQTPEAVAAVEAKGAEQAQIGPLVSSLDPPLLKPLDQPLDPPRADPRAMGASLDPASRRSPARQASARRPLWRRLEQLVVANWTGLLGVGLVVAGVSFVTLNLALSMGPQTRFWLTVGAAAALAMPSLLMGQKEPWQQLAAWMRSGAAALVLFACCAAVGVPDLGLNWLQDPGAALALLLLGGLANLLVALLARSQTIAALHGVLSLVPLMIAAPSALTLTLATLVALVSLLLPWRRPWHGQRLVACLAYATVQGTWVVRSGALDQAGASAPSMRMLAAGAALLVFGCGALLPHLLPGTGMKAGNLAREQSRATDREDAEASGLAIPLQVLLLLSNWGGLGLALLLYPEGPALRFGGLVLAAAGASWLASRGPQANRPWLRRSDSLMGQALAIAATLSWFSPIANGPLLLFALLVETLLFLRLGLDQDDAWIVSLGWWLVNLAGFGLLLAVISQGALFRAVALGTGPNSGPLQTTVLLLTATALTTVMQVQLNRQGQGQDRLAELTLPIPPLLGWLASALAFAAAWCSAPAGWQEPVALVGLVPLLLVGRARPRPGLLSGTATAIVISQGVSWLELLAGQPWSSAELWPRLLALLALGLGLAITCRGGLGLVGIDLVGVSAGLGAFLLLAPSSHLAPLVAWLGLSLLALGTANRIPRAEANQALILGLLYLVGTGLTLVAADGLAAERLSLGNVALPARLLVELAGLGVVLVWWRWTPSPRLAQNRLWLASHPFLLEAFLLGSLVTIGQEVPGAWQPVAWSLLALGLLSPALEPLLAPRLKLYSVLMQWLAIAAVVTSATPINLPSQPWFGQSQQVGLVAIAIQVLYVVASHRLLVLDATEVAGRAGPLARFEGFLSRHRNQALYYPLFLGIALDLASRFDHSILTLLWATQAFILFGLSALLRENQFRYLALGGLGGCLLRLVAVDMVQADLGLRGLVFIGVGLLMLAMNALYNRFRSRFEAS